MQLCEVVLCARPIERVNYICILKMWAHGFNSMHIHAFMHVNSYTCTFYMFESTKHTDTHMHTYTNPLLQAHTHTCMHTNPLLSCNLIYSAIYRGFFSVENNLLRDSVSSIQSAGFCGCLEMTSEVNSTSCLASHWNPSIAGNQEFKITVTYQKNIYLVSKVMFFWHKNVIRIHLNFIFRYRRSGIFWQ